ncbi:RND efflux pump membrane fusion protein barrel-sandwich domain-containing protein [Sphingomonas antarctica]|uniref:efflux RND transporter periplasmic adaptor subunit n=1 Tax=Sphingomonas antarctica TaxID=2040274 RepID=UPI0039EBAFCA
MRDRLNKIVAWAKRHKVWAALIALGLLFIAYQVLKPTRHDYVYVTERVSKGEVVRKVTASGKLRALNTIKVGAEVSGQITRVTVDYNSPVHAGQVLAEIDPTRLRARAQQARAQVAVAEASLAQAQAGAIRASTDIEIQQREFGRRQTLSNRGFISRSTLDTAQSSLAAARAGQRTAVAQVASARAQIAQANAELSSAMLDLSRTTIVAPSDGVIINKLVEPGTTVAASFQTPNLFEIAADTTRMQVEASVDEADIGQVRVGQDVIFGVDAYPGERFSAVVRQIRKAATETANVVSYLVILEVDNRNGKLLPGMTANVEIVTGRIADAVRVPTTALRFRPKAGDRPSGSAPANVRTVFVTTDDPYKPAPRVVTLGLQGEDFVQVTGGLRPGEMVLLRTKSTTKKREVDGDADDTSDGN